MFALACERAETDDIMFIVYGGNKDVKNLCMERHWYWIPEGMDTVKNHAIFRED